MRSCTPLTSITPMRSSSAPRGGHGWSHSSGEVSHPRSCAARISLWSQFRPTRCLGASAARHRSALDRRTEPIATAGHRLDHLGMRRIMFELEPQPLDEDAQIMPLITVGRTPDAVEEGAIVHHLMFVPGELC